VWDVTIVLPPSEIGELAVYAQRKGTTWFLSAINGLQPRIIRVPLSFLDTGNYSTYVLNDDPENPTSAIIINGTANNNDIVEINLDTGGGYMTRFTLK